MDNLSDTSGTFKFSFPEITTLSVTQQMIYLDIAHSIEADAETPAALQTVLLLHSKLTSPKATVDSIKELIKTDEALVTQLIKCCRTANISRHGVESLEDVIHILGFRRIRQLVLSNKLVAALPKFIDRRDSKYWIRSQFVAQIMDHLGLQYEPTSDAYYLTGLLSNVGFLFAKHHIGSELKSLTELIKESDGMWDAEIKFFGYPTNAVGAVLMDRWGVTEPMTAAVSWHHTRSSVRRQLMQRCLHVAHLIADINDVGLLKTNITALDNSPDYQYLLSKAPLPQIDYKKELINASAFARMLV